MSNKQLFIVVLFAVVYCTGCSKVQTITVGQRTETNSTPPKVERIKNQGRVVHVLVALCDNVNHGIVPVPAHLGDGEDPDGNLYWGAAYGVKAFFSKSKKWDRLAEFKNPKEDVLERVVFKHKEHDIYLVADAYRGSNIKKTIDDFLLGASGKNVENVEIGGNTVQILGSANLIVFVGHNGLMDFRLGASPTRHDDEKREAVILACASKRYFTNALKKAGAEPLLWTTNLMAPEAYILHDAIEGWAKKESPGKIRTRAASAYARYQRISQKSAETLLVTGW